MKRTFTIAALLAFFLPQAGVAQEQSPLQANARVRIDCNNRRLIKFNADLEGGGATLQGTVQNLPGGETALVQLTFDYRTNADIALDEIISEIVIWTSDRAGNEFSRVTIDPNTVPLNPNRVPLYYSATVYRPPCTNRNFYMVRIQVFGNYE